jgi:Domain of Unknown Function (DUF1080)
MKKNFKYWVIAAGLFFALSIPAFSQPFNTLSHAEKKQGWILLFNGKNFDGWRQCNGTTVPANWSVEDNAMKVSPSSGKNVGEPSGTDILYSVKKFKNFELTVDWKTSKMGNSGIFINVREVPGKPIYYAAPEIQILDNKDATDNKVPSHLAGSLYDMLPADPAIVKPTGEWNSVVIREVDGKVTETINRVKAVEFKMWTPQWDTLIARSKFKNFPGFTEGISKEGFIGLQEHGYTLWFRNIKIREL